MGPGMDMDIYVRTDIYVRMDGCMDGCTDGCTYGCTGCTYGCMDGYGMDGDTYHTVDHLHISSDKCPSAFNSILPRISQVQLRPQNPLPPNNHAESAVPLTDPPARKEGKGAAVLRSCGPAILRSCGPAILRGQLGSRGRNHLSVPGTHFLYL